MFLIFYILVENAPVNDKKDLLSELDLMKKLRPHPHVIKLMGCVTKTGKIGKRYWWHFRLFRQIWILVKFHVETKGYFADPLLVLIEYIPYGDLLGYLRKSRGLNDTYFKDPDVKPETNLTSEQLIQFALQIADGMNFLSANKVFTKRVSV